MNGPRILIATDNLGQGVSWASALKNAGAFAVVRGSDEIPLKKYIAENDVDVFIAEGGAASADLIKALKSKCSLPLTIVIYSGEEVREAEELIYAGACAVMRTPFTDEELIEKIHEIFSMLNGKSIDLAALEGASEEFDLEYEITDLILRLGIPAHIKGYRFVRYAIMLCAENPDMINYVTDELYPTIAKEFSTTTSRVERAIRHSIELAWDRGDVDMLNSYFGYTVKSSKGKPTNSEFIALIADKIRIGFKRRELSAQDPVNELGCEARIL